MSFAELLDTLEVPEAPYEFPYEDYQIIGDTTEIDKIINTFSYVNLDVTDIISTLSKETVNYVTVGTADGYGSIANALKSAIDKLPIEIGNISSLLFNIWIPENFQSPMTEMELLSGFIKSMPSNMAICWGLSYDESLCEEQAKVTLIAVSK